MRPVFYRLHPLAPLALVVLFGTIQGCARGGNASYVKLAQESFAETPDNTLGARDRFKLEVYPDTGLTRIYTVSPEGTINHPLIGAVRVAGSTCYEIESDIAARLRNGFLQDPSVSCTIEEMNSQRIVVMGAVQTPGPVAYTRGMTLIDLISRVGGFSENAAKDRVQLTRVTNEDRIDIVVPLQKVMRGRAPDMMLKPGDILYVPNLGLLQ